MLWFTGGNNYHWCSNTYGTSFYTPLELGTDPEYYHTDIYQLEKTILDINYIYYDQNNCGTVCAHLNEMHGTCLHGLWLNYHSHLHDRPVENVIGAIDSVFTDMQFAIDPDTSEVYDMMTDEEYLNKFRTWASHEKHYTFNNMPMIPVWSSGTNGGLAVDSTFASEHYLMYADKNTAGGWRPQDCDENDQCTNWQGYFLWIGSLANGNGGMIDGYNGESGRVIGVCNFELKIGTTFAYTECKCRSEASSEPTWCNESKCLGETNYLNASLLASDVNSNCDLDFVQVATWNDWTEGTAIEAGYEKDVTVSDSLEPIQFCLENSNQDGSFQHAASFQKWIENHPDEELFLDCTRGEQSGQTSSCSGKNIDGFGPTYDLDNLKAFITRTPHVPVCDSSFTNKQDCGFFNINESECLDRNCCWNPNTSGDLWCYHKQ